MSTKQQPPVTPDSASDELDLMRDKGCPHLNPPEHHAPRVERDKRRLMIAIGLCVFFMIAEIVGGMMSGSLAVVTDAAHLLSGTHSRTLMCGV